jgi:hypothetical protein
MELAFFIIVLFVLSYSAGVGGIGLDGFEGSQTSHHGEVERDGDHLHSNYQRKEDVTYENAIEEEEDEEQAYRIVHQQLILEGYIDEDVEYDDWLNDSQTWLVIADKCAMHDMYSLATEFYMLSIAKDMEAFKKPMLWFRFAKSCFRCGKIEDAKLAIKVSRVDPLVRSFSDSSALFLFPLFYSSFLFLLLASNDQSTFQLTTSKNTRKVDF